MIQIDGSHLDRMALVSFYPPDGAVRFRHQVISLLGVFLNDLLQAYQSQPLRFYLRVRKLTMMVYQVPSYSILPKKGTYQVCDVHITVRTQWKTLALGAMAKKP